MKLELNVAEKIYCELYKDDKRLSGPLFFSSIHSFHSIPDSTIATSPSLTVFLQLKQVQWSTIYWMMFAFSPFFSSIVPISEVLGLWDHIVCV